MVSVLAGRELSQLPGQSPSKILVATPVSGFLLSFSTCDHAFLFDPPAPPHRVHLSFCRRSLLVLSPPLHVPYSRCHRDGEGTLGARSPPGLPTLSLASVSLHPSGSSPPTVMSFFILKGRCSATAAQNSHSHSLAAQEEGIHLLWLHIQNPREAL